METTIVFCPDLERAFSFTIIGVRILFFLLEVTEGQRVIWL